MYQPSALSNIKTKVDTLNIGKLQTAPVDLKKLSDVVKNESPDYVNLINLYISYTLDP